MLVVETGCGALASAKCGFLLGEAAMEYAGPGLREVCEAIGIPPVLHMGSCVDNTRILTVLSQMATEGGLGDDISDIPAVGLAPEWMSEKAMAIATYVAASGAYVIMGVHNPVDGSAEVTRILSEVWEKKVGGKIEFVAEPDEIVRRTLEHIDKKRAALKLPAYTIPRSGAAAATGASRSCWQLPLEQQAEALYGIAVQPEGSEGRAMSRYIATRAIRGRTQHRQRGRGAAAARRWPTRARQRRPPSPTPPITCR